MIEVVFWASWVLVHGTMLRIPTDWDSLIIFFALCFFTDAGLTAASLRFAEPDDPLPSVFTGMNGEETIA